MLSRFLFYSHRPCRYVACHYYQLYTKTVRTLSRIELYSHSLCRCVTCRPSPNTTNVIASELTRPHNCSRTYQNTELSDISAKIKIQRYKWPTSSLFRYRQKGRHWWKITRNVLLKPGQWLAQPFCKLESVGVFTGQTFRISFSAVPFGGGGGSDA